MHAWTNKLEGDVGTRGERATVLFQLLYLKAAPDCTYPSGWETMTQSFLDA